MKTVSAIIPVTGYPHSIMKLVRLLPFLSILATWFLSAAFVTADEKLREFKSTSGSAIKARIMLVKGDKVTIERGDGKRFTVPTDSFSASDVKYISEWKELYKDKVPPIYEKRIPRVDVDVSTGKTNREDDQFSGYVDEHKQLLAYKLKFTNQDSKYPISNASVTLLVFGSEVATGDRAVVYKQVIQNVRMPFAKEIEIEADPFELWYDDRGAMYGFKYKGYAVYVKEPSGKLLCATSIPSSASSNVIALEKLDAGSIYGSGYIDKGKTSVTRSVKKLK